MMTNSPSLFAQYRTLLAKDLRQEFRTREMLTSMGVYALLVIVVYGAALALTARGVDVVGMGGGLIWVLIVFTSLLGLGRSFAHEKEQGCIEGLLVAPVDRSAIFLAKATSNCLFMLVVELIAVPLFYFFFMTGADVAPTFPALAAPLLVGWGQPEDRIHSPNESYSLRQFLRAKEWAVRILAALRGD